MLATLALWVAVLFVFCSAGYLVVRSLAPDVKVKLDEYFFLGFALYSILASYLSLFFKIDGVMLIVILSIQIPLLMWYAYKEKGLWFSLSALRERHTQIAGLILIGLALVLAFIASSGINMVDTGLYHTQAIKWIRHFPVIPGLANIHGRFGFNSLFFPVTGMFSVFFEPSSNPTQILMYPLNGIAFIMVVYRLFNTASHTKKTSIKLVCFGITVFLVDYYPAVLSSPQPDVICTLILVYLWVLLLEGPGKMGTHQKWLFLLLLAINITFKLSMVFFTALMFPAMLLPYSHKKTIICLGTGFLIVLPFFIRNYILTGYLIYPFPALDLFNPDWKIPLDKVIREKHLIETWARLPRVPLTEALQAGLFDWLPIWLPRRSPGEWILLINSILSPIPLILFIVKKEWWRVWFQVSLMIAVLCWFITAPDIRFAYGLLFCLIGNSVLSADRIVRNLSLPFSKMMWGLILLATVIIHFPHIRKNTDRPGYLTLPAPYPVSQPITRQAVNFQYFNPERGFTCLNGPLLCTPSNLKDIMQRGPRIHDGFSCIRNTQKNGVIKH